MISPLLRWLSKLRRPHPEAPKPVEQVTLTCSCAPMQILWQYSYDDGKTWIAMDGNSFTPTEYGMVRFRGEYVEAAQAEEKS
jgi:hypothetical protein